MLTFEQQIELGKAIIDWRVNKSELKIIDLTTQGFAGIYIYEKQRGGKQLIVGADGKYLTFSSSLNLSKVLDNIKNNNLWDKATLHQSK